MTDNSRWSVQKYGHNSVWGNYVPARKAIVEADGAERLLSLTTTNLAALFLQPNCRTSGTLRLES